jgi:hypothetical protein
MNNKILYLFFVVLMISCGNKPVSTNSLVGEYSDKKIPYIQKLYLLYIFNEYKSFGNSLSLRSDSTYTYINCSSITNGVWSVIGDSLSLTCLDVKWKRDSLSKVMPALECGETAGKAYITKKGDLRSGFKVRKEDNPANKEIYAITWLSKNE